MTADDVMILDRCFFAWEDYIMEITNRTLHNDDG